MISGGRGAVAALAAVSPRNNSFGYPDWYEDSTGTRLELCLDPNDPKCGGLGAEMPNPAAPLSFPNNFPAEAFHRSAEATMPTNSGGGTLLVLALEAAFANEVPQTGQQITFARVRIRVDNLGPGTYTVTHPYGTRVFTLPAGMVPGPRNINDTVDIGGVAGASPRPATASSVPSSGGTRR